MPAKRQTAPHPREEEKPNLEDYKSEEEPNDRRMAPEEVSDMEDLLRR